MKRLIAVLAATLLAVPIAAPALAAGPDTKETATVTWVIPGSTGSVTFPQYLPGHAGAAQGGYCQVDVYKQYNDQHKAKLAKIVEDGTLTRTEDGPEDSSIYLSHTIVKPGVGNCPALPVVVTPSPTPEPTEEPTSTPTPEPSVTSTPEPTTTPSPEPSASATPTVQPQPAATEPAIVLPTLPAATPSAPVVAAEPARVLATTGGETTAGLLTVALLVLAGSGLIWIKRRATA